MKLLIKEIMYGFSVIRWTNSESHTLKSLAPGVILGTSKLVTPNFNLRMEIRNNVSIGPCVNMKWATQIKQTHNKN